MDGVDCGAARRRGIPPPPPPPPPPLLLLLLLRTRPSRVRKSTPSIFRCDKKKKPTQTATFQRTLDVGRQITALSEPKRHELHLDESRATERVTHLHSISDSTISGLGGELVMRSTRIDTALHVFVPFSGVSAAKLFCLVLFRFLGPIRYAGECFFFCAIRRIGKVITFGVRY